VTPAWAAGLAVLLAGGARAAGWFTGPGAVAGAAIAWIVLAGAGFRGLALLGVFVVTSSALSRAVVHSPRGAAQVVANGWTAALGAALVPAAPEAGWAILAGGLAAAQADTWATEIGLRSERSPVSVINGAPVPPGASGGVTRTGTAAGLVGAAAVGAAARALGYDSPLALAVVAAGAAGMLVDSVLGATLQAIYQCAACDAPTDTPRHCGVAGRLVGGRRWITNDVVNAVATGVGGALAAGTVFG
jgi:uncharacterized protein (TIGR00297 family)